MSSILKALKKLEHEKSGRFPDSLNIDSDILKGTDPSRSFSPFVLVLLFLLVFGAGAAATFFFIKEPNGPPTAAKPQQLISKRTLPSATPLPVVKQETLPAEIVVVPAREQQTRETSEIKLHKPPVAVKVADHIPDNPAMAVAPVIPEKPKEASKPAIPDATKVPILRVNGIAFQASAEDSVAIINGIPVSRGSIAEGVTVEEIRNDRVLFQRNGEKFEILLGQSNR